MTRIRSALRRLLDRLFPPAERLPLVMGSDCGDTEEWSGERFIWEPGDSEAYDGEAGR
ncbi:hypothetical protein ACIHEJ_36040 [Streptomyces sp. NPDC052301]|uniref:hypothetical protein n=1 Tax=Streptomyces sp. NPDC052301 TaxID=3365687 RepID=UPI0037CCD5D9